MDAVAERGDRVEIEPPSRHLVVVEELVVLVQRVQRQGCLVVDAKLVRGQAQVARRRGHGGAVGKRRQRGQEQAGGQQRWRPRCGGREHRLWRLAAR